jgi:antitoxin YefM
VEYSFLYALEVDMRTVNFTQLRQNLAAELDSVVDDAEELVVTRSGHDPVVIVPLAEYESMKETEYLLRNPSNAGALRRSIAELDRGEGHEQVLIDPAAVSDVA